MPAKIQTYISHNKPIIVSSDGESYNFVKKNKLGFVSKAEDSNGLWRSLLNTENLKQNQLRSISKASNKVFENNFELNKWIEILEQKLEKCAEAYTKR